LILAFDAPESLLHERVWKRRLQGTDASEADVSVLETQLAGEEPLSDAEKKFSMRLNFSERLPIKSVLERWQQLVRE
jgi:predicted kinase